MTKTFTNYFARAGPLATLGLAAALALGGTPTNLIGSVPFVASMTMATHRRVTAMLKYGTFEGFPAIWNPDEDYGFVLWDEKEGWRKIPTVDLNYTAGLMTKEAFDKAFPNLPPLSKLAS